MPINNQHHRLRSEVVQDILEKTPGWMITWSSSVILLFIFMVFEISWFVKYPDVLTAEATITTAIPSQKEHAQTSGKLTVLFISNNDTVSVGQPLAVIENTANYEDVFLLKRIIDSVQYDRTSFNFQLNEVPILFLGEIESSYVLFENAYLEYELNKSYNPFSTDASENEKSLKEMQKRLQHLQFQQGISKEELALKSKDYERHKTLYEQRAISEQNFEQKRLELLRMQSGFESTQLAISQLQEQIVTSTNNFQRIALNKTRSDISLLKNVIQAFTQLKNSIRVWELKYVLKSEIVGRVLFYNNWNDEKTVEAGDLVFTIVPQENQEFIAKLNLPAFNAGKVEINQRVLIELNSFPKVEYGTLIGSIKQAPIATDDKGFYTVTVHIPNGLITSYNRELEFNHEIEGSAEIITNDLRLIERFFYGLRKNL